MLPDLRNHGKTGPQLGPHTLHDCAGDLLALPAPEWVIGHSFGGKVALTWARDHGTDQQVWALDSVPFADRSGSNQVIEVLTALRSARIPAAERSDLRADLEASGLQGFLVDWLLTSAKRHPDGWRWVYDLDGISEMMASYLTTDFGADLDAWSGTKLHVVRAERSDRWRPEWVERLRAHPNVDFRVLPDAGHWLHVDNPAGMRLMLLA